MAATKIFPALTTIAETFGPGKLRILDKSTIDIFDEAMILAADTIMPGRNRGVALVMSPAEWNALPENDLGNGNFRPQPFRPPDIPDRPVPLGVFAPAGDVRAYDLLCSVRADAILDDANMTAAITALKEIYKNPAIVGERNAKIAIGNGDMMARRLDTPAAMRARLLAYLGTPDQSTFAEWGKLYNTPSTDMDVSEWILLEAIAHLKLTEHRRALNDTQRVDAFIKCYEASPGVSTCVRAYNVAVPALADQTFDDLVAYVTAQEPNIRKTLTRAAVGYSAQTFASAAEPPKAHAATTQTMYSQAQLDAAIAAALAKHDRKRSSSNSTSAPKYCWLHGHTSTHQSADCFGCRDGKTMAIRYPGDETRCFSHSQCQHVPPCINAADARRATKPDSFPETPGNNNRQR